MRLHGKVAVAVCDINEESAQRASDEIESRGGNASAVKLDVCDTASIDSMVESVMKKFGCIDILVNAAGGSARERWSPVHGSKEEVIRELIDVNLFGTIFCCRAVVGHMIKKKFGRIVNIGSVLGVQKQAGSLLLQKLSRWRLELIMSGSIAFRRGWSPGRARRRTVSRKQIIFRVQPALKAWRISFVTWCPRRLISSSARITSSMGDKRKGTLTGGSA